MKKIIGILLAGALVTSAFAADVSAKVEVDASLFNFDGSNISAFTIGHKSLGHVPDLAVSFNGDRAGATAEFLTSGTDKIDNDNFAIKAQNYSIWFKPFDMLKVTVGRYSTNMNQEQIDWCNTDSGIDSQGYALDLNVDAFFATAFLAPGWGKSFVSVPDGGDFAMGQLYVKAGYGADFGRIQAMFRLVNLKDMLLGVGYDNTFGSVKMFVNALVGFDDGYTTPIIRGEAYASTNIDAFGISAFVAGGYNCDNEAAGLTGWHIGNTYYDSDKITLGASLKLTYALGACTPYVYVKSANILADSFSINVKPGLTGNLGGMAWELAADMNISDKFTIDVPVSFTVAF